jgi:hypothetical protein
MHASEITGLCRRRKLVQKAGKRHICASFHAQTTNYRDRGCFIYTHVCVWPCGCMDDCVITVLTDSYIHCSLFVITSVSTILW